MQRSYSWDLGAEKFTIRISDESNIESYNEQLERNESKIVYYIERIASEQKRLEEARKEPVIAPRKLQRLEKEVEDLEAELKEHKETKKTLMTKRRESMKCLYGEL